MVSIATLVGDRVYDRAYNRHGTVIERKSVGRITVVFRIRWDEPGWEDSFRAV